MKEVYYLVLPASESSYRFSTIKRDTEDALIPSSFAALFEKNPLLVLQSVDNGKDLFVSDIFGGLEELSDINPLNEELFSKWVNRFDYLCLIMESLGLQAHVPYVVGDSNPVFGKWISDPKINLVKIAKSS